mgnify:CR=1 FL=1
MDGCLTQAIRDIIYRLGSLARWISSKEIRLNEIPQRKREVYELVCLMEKELPISFFDIQVHLLVHLVEEIELAGVVNTRWMFWVERFMCVLKRFVRQRARPEGSMAEGWLHQECMYYLSEYLPQAHEEAPLNWTHDESSTMTEEVLCGKGSPIRLSHEEQENLTTFIINNSECMTTFLEEYKVTYSNDARGRGRKARRLPSLLEWIQERIKQAQQNEEEVTREQLELSIGCDRVV